MQHSEILSAVVETKTAILEAPPQGVAISFVIPTFDEEQSIRELYARLAAKLDGLGQGYEIIFVDDGSTDGTAEAVARSFPETTILTGDGSLFWNRGMHVAFDLSTDLLINLDEHGQEPGCREARRRRLTPRL